MSLDNSNKTTTPPRRSGFWAGLLSGIFSLAVVGGLLGFLLSPELLKHRTALPLEEEIGASRVSAAIPADYKTKANPVADNNDNLLRGQQIYNSNCSFCHGVSGNGDAAIGKGMFPLAANLLDQKTVKKSDGEIYWILENGLAFVGMPTYKDILGKNDDLWKAVNYVRALQQNRTDKITAAPAAVATVPAPAQTAVTGNNPTSVPAPTSNQGLVLFRSQGCAGCHGGDAATGGIGPKIANTAYPLAGFLVQVRKGAGVMPPYPASKLSDADVKQIHDYLKTLTSTGAANPSTAAVVVPNTAVAPAPAPTTVAVPTSVAPTVVPTSVAYTAVPTNVAPTVAVVATVPATVASAQTDTARGLVIFKTNGCTNCHGGDEAVGGLGPKLASTSFPIDRFIKQVHEGEKVMPAYPNISDSDINLMYAYLQTLKR